MCVYLCGFPLSLFTILNIYIYIYFYSPQNIFPISIFCFRKFTRKTIVKISGKFCFLFEHFLKGKNVTHMTQIHRHEKHQENDKHTTSFSTHDKVFCWIERMGENCARNCPFFLLPPNNTHISPSHIFHFLLSGFFPNLAVLFGIHTGEWVVKSLVFSIGW